MTAEATTSRRAAIHALLRARMQCVRGAMSDEVFETLLERMTDQQVLDELRANGRHGDRVSSS